jgi:hypothetical protein
MAGPMRRPEWIERIRREAGAGLRLVPWLLLSLLLVLMLWGAHPTALAGLFQSPPADTPTVPATSTSEPVPSPQLTETPVLTATPVISVTPTATDTPVTPPSATPTAAPTETPTVTATPLPPTDAQVGTPPSATGEDDESGGRPGRYAEGESSVRFDWGMLFDAAALGLSYVWLCCGGLIVVGVALFFLVLWVASSRRRRTE